MRWSCRCHRQCRCFIQTLFLSASLSFLVSCQHRPRRKFVRPRAEVMEEPVIKRRKVVTTAVIPHPARTALRPLPAPKPGSPRETEAARTVRPRPLHVNEKVESSCASHADILHAGKEKHIVAGLPGGSGCMGLFMNASLRHVPGEETSALRQGRPSCSSRIISSQRMHPTEVPDG